MATERSTRVLFVDLARAAAILFMIQGHTLQVLLGPEHRDGLLFDGWLFLRGLTSCAFLVLSGFSFSLATDRYWNEYVRWSPRLGRRLRRFAVFFALGYAMHIPDGALAAGSALVTESHAFTAVDILQLVAVTLVALQALAWIARTRRALGVCALAGALAVVMLTPLASRLAQANVLPTFAVAYLSTATGSLFPLFPWAAYILLGASLGVWFVTGPARAATPTTDVSRTFLLAGGLMIGAGAMLHQVPLSPYGPIDFWTISPNLFLVKAGSVLVLLAGAVRVTRSLASLPHSVSALSRESLTVYLVHVCILYGSVWNGGLAHTVGARLGPFATAGCVLALIAAMWTLAVAWHDCKERSTELPAAIRLGFAMSLFYAIA